MNTPPVEINEPLFTRIPFSKIALVAVNFLPILGILFWNWNTYIILLLYFIETFVAGFFAAAKIYLAKKDYYPIPGAADISMLSADADLAINYMPKIVSVFKFLGAHILITVVVSLFCFFFFPIKIPNLSPFLLSLEISAVGFIISFSISFKRNYLNKYEYLRTSPRDIFRRHILRLVMIFVSPLLAILAIHGIANTLDHYGFTSAAGSLTNDFIYNKTTAIVLIILVTIVDYIRHILEHKSLEEFVD